MPDCNFIKNLTVSFAITEYLEILARLLGDSLVSQTYELRLRGRITGSEWVTLRPHLLHCLPFPSPRPRFAQGAQPPRAPHRARLARADGQAPPAPPGDPVSTAVPPGPRAPARRLSQSSPSNPSPWDPARDWGHLTELSGVPQMSCWAPPPFSGCVALITDAQTSWHRRPGPPRPCMLTY